MDEFFHYIHEPTITVKLEYYNLFIYFPPNLIGLMRVGICNFVLMNNKESSATKIKTQIEVMNSK